MLLVVRLVWLGLLVMSVRLVILLEVLIWNHTTGFDCVSNGRCKKQHEVTEFVGIISSAKKSYLPGFRFHFFIT